MYISSHWRERGGEEKEKKNVKKNVKKMYWIGSMISTLYSQRFLSSSSFAGTCFERKTRFQAWTKNSLLLSVKHTHRHTSFTDIHITTPCLSHLHLPFLDMLFCFWFGWVRWSYFGNPPPHQLLHLPFLNVFPFLFFFCGFENLNDLE